MLSRLSISFLAAALALGVAWSALAADHEGPPSDSVPDSAAPAAALRDPSAPEAPAIDALVRHLRAARRTGEIVLDGRPDEAAWQSAEEGQGFTQLTPDEGQPAAVKTRFRVLWDDESLYVGITCDDPQAVTARLSRRDRQVDGDWVSIDLDTTLDHRTAYHFQVFAGGHQLDGLHYDDTNFTTDWDAAWESQVAFSDSGWSVEMKIPLRVLRIPVGASQFGFNVYRHLVRRQEDDQFRYRPRGTPGDISRLGVLDGLAGITPVRALELRPYFGARATRSDPWPGPVRAPGRLGLCSSLGFAPQALATACTGLDVRYNLSSDLALVATLNPDFGQVEADQLVLNLSTFETFFPEKRPFFLQGLDLFQTLVGGTLGGSYGGAAYQLFYSRRIGKPPPGPDLSDGGRVLYEPGARPVAAAVKLTGTVGAASVGMLASLEQPVDAQVYCGQPGGDTSLTGTPCDGKRGQVIDQQSAGAVGSAALRARVPLGKNFLAGVMGTAVDPLYSPGARHAHVASADFVLFNEQHSLTLSGQATGSLINGGGRAVLRDGTVFDAGSGASGSGVGGGAGVLTLDYTGEYTGAFGGVDWMSKTFTTRDLGFQRRANLARAFGIFNLRQPHPTGLTQRIQLSTFGKVVRNSMLDVQLYAQLGMELNISWINSWYSQIGDWLEAQGADDRELQDGTPLERQKGTFLYTYHSTDQRKPMHLELFGGYRRDLGGVQGQRYYEADVTIGLRPHPQLEGALDLGYSLDDGTIRSLGAATTVPSASAPPAGFTDAADAVKHDRLYLLAPLRARSITATLRATFAFSPTLTLQAYAQLFTAGLAYGDALRVQVAPGKALVHLSDLSPAQATDLAPNNDDREAGLNVNLILRWEWRLGSTLYLVYAHQTSNAYNPTPMRRGLDLNAELGALSRSQGAANGDSVLLKIDLLGAL